jgi:hypothetical protein
VTTEFSAIESPEKKRAKYSQKDVLICALAMFMLKYSSLLKFDEEREKEHIKNNLKNLYGVGEVPCDTQMRTILDPVDPKTLRPAFSSIINDLHSNNQLNDYKYIEDYYILSVDGSGIYSSSNMSCPDCCVKKLNNGETSYYHQLLSAAIVHPNKKVVIPLAPEPIVREKNASKNDCERNASKRLLKQLKKEYPGFKFIVVEDSLSSNEPHINLLKSLGYIFVIGVKESDHQYLFECVQDRILARQDQVLEEYDEKLKITRGVRFVNNLSLNKSNPDLKVNFLEYWEYDEYGEMVTYFTWVTDILLTTDNAFKIVKIGRARWKIENEVFNTLKNQGYHLEHNYGHGEQHLSSVFAMLMMLAFLIDQIQELLCPLFQQAKENHRTKSYLWLKMQALFILFSIPDWETFYLAIALDHKVPKLEIATKNEIVMYLDTG